MRSNRFSGESGAAILTESGAFKALSLDLAEEVGLDLPEMHDADSPAMRAALPDFVPVSNPVDLTAQALVDPELYQRAIAALVLRRGATACFAASCSGCRDDRGIRDANDVAHE